MFVIPAVDIKNGKCVQLVQGKPGTEQIVIENPVQVAKDWEERGANVLHLIDLDGALDNKIINLKIIKDMLKEISIPIQMGGGIRNKDYAIKLLHMGISKVILGTLAINSPEIVFELSQEFGKDRIIVALDSKGSKVVIEGWREKTEKNTPEFAKFFEEKGCGAILYTNVDVEGLMQGFDTRVLMELLGAVNIPVIYSGGVTSIDDLNKLHSLGVFGVVIGSALYKKKIKFEDALIYEEI
jgi:phosphoribosylformimino-5-aminoimidazole carboxamide ribotide isomerase